MDFKVGNFLQNTPTPFLSIAFCLVIRGILQGLSHTWLPILCRKNGERFVQRLIPLCQLFIQYMHANPQVLFN